MGKFLINAVTKATTTRGKEYLRLMLYEPGGKLWKAVFWENKDGLKPGQLIDAFTEESEFGGEAQLTIKALRVLDEDPSDLFLPRTSQSVDGLMRELTNFVDSVENDQLHKLLVLAIADERWKRAPAAQKQHHAFLGGLLEHTVNLCRLGDAVAKLYPIVRRDLLITGAILHDIGKIDEMSCGTTIEYTAVGNLVGHVAIGLLRVAKWMDELQFDDALRITILHIIGSHHGNLNFGAIKTPAILEAQIFSNLDGIDANIGKITALIEAAGPGKEWTNKPDFGSSPIWLGPVEKK